MCVYVCACVCVPACVRVVGSTRGVDILGHLVVTKNNMPLYSANIHLRCIVAGHIWFADHYYSKHNNC